MSTCLNELSFCHVIGWLDICVNVQFNRCTYVRPVSEGRLKHWRIPCKNQAIEGKNQAIVFIYVYLNMILVQNITVAVKHIWTLKLKQCACKHGNLFTVHIGWVHFHLVYIPVISVLFRVSPLVLLFNGLDLIWNYNVSHVLWMLV